MDDSGWFMVLSAFGVTLLYTLLAYCSTLGLVSSRTICQLCAVSGCFPVKTAWMARWRVTSRSMMFFLFCFFVGCMVGDHVVAKHTIPYNVHVGVDMAKLSYGLYRRCQSPLEFYGSVSFYPLLLEWDYGIDGYYLCDMPHGVFYLGKYVKLGVGYNFIKPTRHANQFSLGARYAISLGSDSVRRLGKPSEHRVMASWLEWVACAKVSLIPFVYIGSSLRFKVAKTVIRHGSTIRVGYLPGWGSADSRLGYGYNFYIGFVIPFRKILN